MQVETIPTEELGDRSYVAHDGTTAVVVDPQRDLDRVERLLDARGLTCRTVAETHVHNDYVTGGYELARRTGAAYVMSGEDKVAFDRYPIRPDEEVVAGGLTVRALATPGHTDTHLAYLVSDGEGPAAVFTGGSLLYGTVGRTDLVDPRRAGELAHEQYRSAHRLASTLPEDTMVFPTHGFGSFCSSGPAASGDGATIAVERARNGALVEVDEDAFVARLTAGFTAYPRYYAHMGARNREGPGPADLSPATPVEPAEMALRIAAGEWVIDLRDRRLYAARHVGGTVGVALEPQFATYLGWVVPWGMPLTLVGGSPEQVAAAQRQLVRIGIDRPAGAAVGTPESLAADADLRGYPTATFADVAGMGRDDGTVLDVRRDDERAAGCVPGSAHVPLHSLLDRLDEVPAGRLWVHCAGGFRASIAASLLDRDGRDVVLVDDDYASAVTSGLATG